MTSIRILTVKQPFAAAIVAGVKRCENRSWQTHYRGTLLIHAGKAKDRLDILDDVNDDRMGELIIDRKTLPFAAIVGVVTLNGCYELAKYDLQYPDDAWASGAYCWRLEDAIALPTPIPCGGQVGLWIPTAEILQGVRDQLPGVKLA